MTILPRIFLLCIIAVLFGYFHSFADNELHADYFRRIAQSPSNQPQERIEAYNALIKTDPRSIDSPLSLDIAKLYISLREYEHADSLLELISRNKGLRSDLRCRLLHLQGWTAFYMKDYGRAMNSALDLLSASKSDSLYYRNADSYILMADIFNLLGNYSFGERCAVHAGNILNSIKKSDNWRKTQSIICLSNSLLGQDKCEKAFETLKRGRNIATDSIHINAILGTLGMLCYMKGDSIMAEKYYREALEIPGNSINNGAQVLNLVAIKLANGNYADAKDLMHSYDDILSNIDNPNMLRGVNEAKAAIFVHEGRMEDAVTAMNEALTQAQAANFSEREIYNQQLSDQFEELLKKLENKKEHANDIWIVASVTAIIIVLIGVGWIIWKYRKAQTYKHTELQTQIEYLKKQMKENNEESSKDLELKNKSLVGMSMHLARITEGLEKIQDLSSDDNQDIDKRMANIRSIIRQLDSEDNVWETFKIYFEQVNQSFFNNLYKVQPNLTNAEVRMSAFILMNLTSKEIAILTNRSVRTVESIKYNLRKKLAITESTESFMRKLATSVIE